MKQTWRWFGPDDTISIDALLQVGVEGVVSALYHVPTGDVWPRTEIAKRQIEIAHFAGSDKPSGLDWSVVESLPVSEDIKRKAGDFKTHVANYKTSLTHLAEAGIEVICYNFMPVLDWTRTELRRPLAHGGTAMAFDLIDFAAFDLFILERAGAADDYEAELVTQARERYAQLRDEDKATLLDNLLKGLPGATESWSLGDVRAQLQGYAGIDAETLYANLIDFLGEIVPHAEALGLRLCCHPDDPPFPLLGLPRIMSSVDDYARLVGDIDSPANGITFCTGSLGVDPAFDGPGFIERLGPKIHFAHLRNTTRQGFSSGRRYSFYEAAHLEGDSDMAGTVRALMQEQARRRAAGRSDWQMPMRPDHGHDLLSDLDQPGMPGYPLIGRMRGLAELRGLMAAFGASS
ncbi:MAG: mannonate dehydratase [Pseudomonadota bacterium]